MRVAFLGCVVSLCEGEASGLSVVSEAEGVYRVEACVSNVVLNRDLIACAVEGAERIEEPNGTQTLPAFVRVLPVPAGYWASLELVQVSRREMEIPRDAGWDPGPDEPLSVEVGRMGGRAFLRVVYRPFQPDPEAGTMMICEKVQALVRLHDALAQPVLPRATTKSPPSSTFPFGLTCPPRMPVGTPGDGGTAGDFSARRSVTNDVAWRIQVSEPGLYRLTGYDLQQAGVPDTYRDTSQLRLSVRDEVMPFWRSTAGAMQSNDWIMFYGAAVDSATTTQNVYWLSTGSSSPDATAVQVPVSAPAPVVTSSWSAADYAVDSFYRPNYNPLVEDYDHWFAMEVQGGTTSNILLATPDPVQTGNVYLAYTLHGVNAHATNPDHRSEVSVGGQGTATNDYDGQALVARTSSVPASALGATSTVSVRQVLLPGVPHVDYAKAYVESLRLYYQRRLVADNAPFYFSRSDTAVTLRVSGVTTGAFWLLDVTDPAQPSELQGYTLVTNAGSRTLSFTDVQGGVRYYALIPTVSVLAASAPALTRFRDLGQVGRQADYLAVAPVDFREPVYRLLKHRFKNGLSVQVASPQDVYNEFSYGVTDPAALRQYFGYAFHHYAAPPAYALFVGTGSYDPLNRLGVGESDRIPVRLGASPQRRTALEQWFVTVDGTDLLPDISLGRITATNVADVTRAVGKIIAFETAPTSSAWFGTALLAADNDAAHIFKAHAETNTRTHLVAGGFDAFDVTTAYLDDLSPEQCRLTIQNSVASGLHLLHYMGHGSVGQWASENIWNRTNALALANSVYPIITVFSCQVGAFHEPGDPCLADAIILSAGAGSACVAPTALSTQTYAERLADGFHEALAEDRVPRLGDALQAGFLRLWTFNPNVAELRTYLIVGDPAQLIWGGATP